MSEEKKDEKKPDSVIELPLSNDAVTIINTLTNQEMILRAQLDMVVKQKNGITHSLVLALYGKELPPGTPMHIDAERKVLVIENNRPQVKTDMKAKPKADKDVVP